LRLPEPPWPSYDAFGLTTVSEEVRHAPLRDHLPGHRPDCALFGFTGLASDFAWIGKILALVFVILFLVSLIMGRRAP